MFINSGWTLTIQITIFLLRLIETDVFQMPQLYKHFNVVRSRPTYTFKRLIFETTTYQMTTKENIISTLTSHKSQLSGFGVQSIGLFGSYARNEQSDKSDIDLLIDFQPEKENFDNYMAVYDLVENIFKGERIEVVTKNGLSKYIGPKILNDVMYV
jgi:predicted nucleotidyltransferase